MDKNVKPGKGKPDLLSEAEASRLSPEHAAVIKKIRGYQVVAPYEPYIVNKALLNNQVADAILKRLSDPQLLAEVTTMLKAAPLEQFIIGLYAMKVEEGHPQLEQAWNDMMDELAPRDGTTDFTASRN